MSVITHEIRTEWKETLQPYLQDADAQDLTIRVAGGQGLGIHESPTTQAEVDTVLDRAENVCEDVISPHVAAEYDPDVVIEELCSILESHLRESLEEQQEQSRKDVQPLKKQLNKSRAEILRSGMQNFRLTVSRNIVNELRYRSDSTIKCETVEELVTNLDHGEDLVRRMAGRALSEIAKQYPDKIRTHLDQVCTRTGDSSAAIGCLCTLLRVLEYGDPEVEEIIKISETAGKSLRAQSEECQHMAIAILERVVENSPKAIPAEAIDELLDTRMHPDPTLGRKAKFVLDILDQKVDLNNHGYNPEKTFKHSSASFGESGPRIPTVPNIDFDDEPSNAGLATGPWTNDCESDIEGDTVYSSPFTSKK